MVDSPPQHRRSVQFFVRYSGGVFVPRLLPPHVSAEAASGDGATNEYTAGRLDEKEKEPSHEKWTDEDEAALVALTATDFDLKDTQLGRLEASRKREFEGAIKRMPKDEALEYVQGLFGMVNNAESTAEV